MEKTTIAYFGSEDDALEAMNKLRILGARKLSVEPLEQDRRGLSILPAAPFFTGNMTTSSGGTGGTSGFGAVAFRASADADGDDFLFASGEHSKPSTVLSYVIDPSKAEAAREIIREAKGRVYQHE